MNPLAYLTRNVQPVLNAKILLSSPTQVQKTNVSELHKKEKNVKVLMSSPEKHSLTVLKDSVADQLA